LAEPVLRTRQIPSFSCDAAQRVHRPGICRIQINDALQNADRLVAFALATAHDTLFQQARGFQAGGVGNRPKLHHQSPVAHRKRGIGEQFRLVGAKPVNNLLLGQRSKVCGMKKLEVSQGDEKDHDSGGG